MAILLKTALSKPIGTTVTVRAEIVSINPVYHTKGLLWLQLLTLKQGGYKMDVIMKYPTKEEATVPNELGAKYDTMGIMQDGWMDEGEYILTEMIKRQQMDFAKNWKMKRRMT